MTRLSLLRTAALLVPAIRRLHEERRRLHEERDALLAGAGVERAGMEGRLIVTDYPYYPHSRRIEDAAGGKRLIARLIAEEDRYAATLRGMAQHVGSLLRIPRSQED